MDNMENKAGIAEKIAYYKGDVEVLVKYLTWLEQKNGQKMARGMNPGEQENITMQVPVYDSTLLSFVKAAGKTAFMNRNFVYTYSKNRIKDFNDELRYIEKAQIMDMQGLGDILSKYVLKGQQKGYLWSEGLENGVFLALVKKMKSLIEFWTVPM